MSVAAFAQHRLSGLNGLPYPTNPTILGWQTSYFSTSKTIGISDTTRKQTFWNGLPEALQQEFYDYQNAKEIPGLPGYSAKALLAPVANGTIYSGPAIYAQGFGVVFTITNIKKPLDFGQIGPFFNSINIADVIKANVDKPGFWINVSNPNFHKDMTLAILAFTAVVAAGAMGVGAPAATTTTATGGTTAATTAATTAGTAATTAATTGGTTAAVTGGTGAATLLSQGKDLLQQGKQIYSQVQPLLEKGVPLPGNAPQGGTVAPTSKLDLKSVAIPIGVALAALYAAST